MLKPRSCYSSKETYDYAFFREHATVQAFALDPALKVQVKFVLSNEKTDHLKLRDRFIICDETGASRMFYKKDAEEILNLLEVIKNPLVKEYKACTGQISYQDRRDNNITKPTISALIKGNDVRICGWGSMDITAYKNDPGLLGKEFIALTIRFAEILKAFLGHCEGKPITINNHFGFGRYMMLPLCNSGTDLNVPHYLRLMWIKVGKIDNICLSAKGRNILFYSLNKENTSTLEEICEGFIDALYRIVDDFNKVTDDDIDSFISSYSVQLTEDRKHFMEYVGARGMTVPDGENAQKNSMLIQMNSDAAPASSKTMLRFDAQFVNDLIDGLRFCYEYEI